MDGDKKIRRIPSRHCTKNCCTLELVELCMLTQSKKGSQSFRSHQYLKPILTEKKRQPKNEKCDVC
jgi:hypothetical protein